MASGPVITAKFVADTKGLTDGVDKATTESGSKVGNFAKGAATAIGSAFATGAIIDFAKQSIDAASNLQESVSKVGVVFGQSGKDILNWSKNAAEAMGMSQQQALEAAGTYGNLAVSLGLPQEQAASMSKSLVGLAADMASFNNVPVDQALEALRSGLTGETEPLKKFGVNLNEAALKAKAMQMGLSDGKGTLDANAKAQASYALIMEQSTTAQGDFARTADGLANSQKTAAAQTEDMKAQMGEALLPVMQQVTAALKVMIPIFEQFAPIIVPLAAAIGIYSAALSVATTIQTAFGVSLGLSVGWIALIAVGIAALVAGIIWAWNNVDWFRNGVQAAFRAVSAAFVWVKDAAVAVFNWIKQNWPLLLAILTGPFGLAVTLVVRNWDSIKSAAQTAYDFIVGVFAGLANAITWPIKFVWNALASTWNSTVGKINVSIPDWVPLVGGKSFDVPDLPRLAKGGIVSRPTIAMIGEAGPEAVIPLDRFSGTGGDTVFNISVSAGVGDPAEIGRKVIDAIRAAERVQGKGWRAA